MKKLLFFLLFSIPFSLNSLFAATTPVDLYRLGNASYSKIDNVRDDDDAITFMKNGQVWVKGSSKRGVSLFSTPNKKKYDWKLPKGSFYPDALKLVNDKGNHWQFEPAKDMPLSDFQDLLRQIPVDNRASCLLM